ncbi:MAG: hypothetical protein JW856_01685 [Dehalococcoidales bacterium]|nr:hypothetical protein [Dehalococcoidales bacterium]
MAGLLNRIRGTGFVILVGIVFIIYIAFAILYFQQAPKQKDFSEQIASLQIIVNKPLPNTEKLMQEYDQATNALIPIMVPSTLSKIVSLEERTEMDPQEAAYLNILDKIIAAARDSGLDVDETSGKFTIPAPTAPVKVKVGSGQFQVLSLKGLKIRGAYDSVMEFIRRLDKGEIISTLALKKVIIEETPIDESTEEGMRIKEYNDVKNAIDAMMKANDLTLIPNPTAGYKGGKATNDMSAFPDSISGWATSISGKTTDANGNNYSDGDKRGYVLYQNDDKADDSNTQLTDYISVNTTKYYYTCDADGTLRQFDGPDVTTATEHTNQNPNETQAFIDIDLYCTPPATTSKTK